MIRFLVVIEKANSNYSAYSPDLPGFAAIMAHPAFSNQLYVTHIGEEETLL